MARYGHNESVWIQTAQFGSPWSKREVKVVDEGRAIRTKDEGIGFIQQSFPGGSWHFYPYYKSFQECEATTLNGIADIIEDQEHRRVNG